MATFRRSLYVRDEGGAIACLGVPGLGAGPLNALCDGWPDEPIVAGVTTNWAGSELEIGARWRFDFLSAATWQPAPLPACSLARALPLLASTAAADVAPRGLGRIIQTLLQNAPWACDDPFERAGSDGVIALARWLAVPVAEPPAAIERLIGLGRGLTPSGDDALGGAMIAARAFGDSELADRLAAWLMPRAKTATSDISFAHLAAAAEGQGAAALHDTMHALACADRTSLIDGLRRLDAIGHSSGWDALAGATAALVALRG